ncbi:MULTISPECIES: EAL domain-containing protein [unclassified Bacillus (in: firmicutes)]|uniref:EAL domain-containing protein n=1 Tax=unclassified Bacillus (in: firmicutes) TaxID=185979 RepID=UPI0008EE127D|nr:MULTISPECIES: EAL-associated domain-containing protein [unclassified Bacillus (in: firmicutes)]SFA76744.1 EAL domain, c-di-GMP-specific phosphodiesterase class I (or its enzymatically inactive variant) [Bacillus sp. UNCCL13]SFQ66612.1 EAL domain, c-di-GMP-specific phosphodiesterase class I (or its enzymatically inactive variant) [Bacillus sp. cl95]
MDALDILTNLENVVPFFQPIFSADEHLVIGYEILGRYCKDGDIMSLGPFFQDEQIPEEYRIEVDQLVLLKALQKAVDQENNDLLFVNKDASLLMYDDGESFLQTLLLFQDKGIQLDRIVLEINDSKFDGEHDQLDHLLNYYRTFGIKIAIAKMGNDRSHLDRIGQLEPDILKVNLSALRSSTTASNFQDIVYTLALLARKIGATLLFENIEMSFQLQFAWKKGGRYYQGYYLATPTGDFVDPSLVKDRLKGKFHDFINHEKKKLETIYSTATAFHNIVLELANKYKKQVGYEELFKHLMREMNDVAFRMYVCDVDGFQISPNFFKSQSGWVVQQEYVQKNWSWRPYFLENIVKMKYEKKGLLSDLYSDIETGETVRTFSFPISVSDFLFIDISYTYLFEHEGLL